MKPEYSYENKGTNFSCVAKVQTDKTVFAVGTDKTIRQISYEMKEEKNESSVSAKISSDKEADEPAATKELMRYESYTNFSQVALLNGDRGIIVGTADDDRPGMIIIFRKKMDRSCDIQAHSLPVERIKLTFDNNILFSAGQDGSFFMFDLKDPTLKRDKEPPAIQFSEAILTEKSELRELQQAIDHLKRENEQLKQHKEAETRRIEAQSQEKIAKLQEERDMNKRNAEKKRKELEHEITELNKKYNDEIEDRNRKNDEEIERRRRDFEEKKEQDKIRYQELSQKMEKEQKKIHDEMDRLRDEHDAAIEKLREDNRKELKKQSETVDKLSNQIKEMESENKKIRDEREIQYWEEIDAIKEKNKAELYKITKAGMDAKADLTLTNEKCNKSKSEREGYEQTIKEKQDQLNNEIQKQTTLRGEIEGQRNEIGERTRTIADKETRILQLKKKTQELEKFKFVLDYKIKELKRDINPKNQEIDKLNEQTTKMDQELKHFHRVNQNLSLIVDDLKMRQEGLQKEVKDQEQKLEKQESYQKKFKDDLYDAMKSINNYKDLKSAIVGLHKKYVLEEVKTDQGEADLQKEYASYRKFLEKTVNYLRIEISKDSTNHRNEYTRYMKENVTLLQEINDLRKEVKTLGMLAKKQQSRHGSTIGKFSMRDDGSKAGGKDLRLTAENEKELKMQDAKIQELQEELIKLQEENQELNNRARSSRGARKLPPITRPGDEEAKEDIEHPRIQESEKRLDDFKDEEDPNRRDETANNEEDGDNPDEN